jgi:two-component system phosphate regulon sensor histidine kinase PhoR
MAGGGALGNAYKYSPGEKRIALRVFRENRRVVFAVEDHGIGIAARERNKIFRRFYQGDRSLARDPRNRELIRTIRYRFEA